MVVVSIVVAGACSGSTAGGSTTTTTTLTQAPAGFWVPGVAPPGADDGLVITMVPLN